MNPFDLTRELSFEEVKQFFSKNSQYTVTLNEVNNPKCVVITLKWLQNFEVVDKKEIYTYDSVSNTVYKPTIQSLITAIQSLGFIKAQKTCTKETLKS